MGCVELCAQTSPTEYHFSAYDSLPKFLNSVDSLKPYQPIKKKHDEEKTLIKNSTRPGTRLPVELSAQAEKSENF